MFSVVELISATKGRLVSGRRDAFVTGISIDSRSLKKGEAFLAIKGNNFDGHKFIRQAIDRGASCVIVSNTNVCVSVGISCIKVGDTTRALGDIALFHHRRLRTPIIAVTGSNGKTTAKEMIASVLAGKYRVLKNEGTKNNHIGVPMAMLALNKQHELAVLELGTNHPGEIGYLAKICEPAAAVITNIGPSHLEAFGSLPGVLREKYKLISNLKHPRMVFFNADDKYLSGNLKSKNKKYFTVGFGIKSDCEFKAKVIAIKGGRLNFSVSSNIKNKFTIKTPGYYNVYNALAAIAVARVFGLDYKVIVKRLGQFNFPAGRLNIRKKAGVIYIDDTYNSNPLSLQQALRTLDLLEPKGRKIVVMGDMFELGRRKEMFHYQAGQQAAKACDVLVAVGSLSRQAAAGARNQAMLNSRIFTCRDSREAKAVLFKQVIPLQGDIVLVKGSRGMKMETVLS